MNITEKILARASGRDKLEPDEVIFANIDKIMLHDVSGPGVIKTFEKLENDGVIKVDKLFDPSMIWVTEDHFVPSVDKISATCDEIPYFDTYRSFLELILSGICTCN